MLSRAFLSLLGVSLLCGAQTSGQPSPTEPQSECLVVWVAGRVYAVTPAGATSVIAEGRRHSVYPKAVPTPDGHMYFLNEAAPKDPVGLLEIIQLIPGQTVGEAASEVRPWPECNGYWPWQTRLSPDGRFLAFRAEELPEPPNTKGPVQLFVVHVESGALRRLTSFDDTLDWIPVSFSWSPKSDAIAFYWAPSYVGADPVVMDVGVACVSIDGELRRLSEPQRHRPGYGAMMGLGPVWAPDGSMLYFDADYESKEKVPNSFTSAVSPYGGVVWRVCPGAPTSITPDGRYLYASDAVEHSTRVDLRTGERTELSSDWRYAIVSRTGRFVACISHEAALNIFSSRGRLLASLPQGTLGEVFSPEDMFWIVSEHAATGSGSLDGLELLDPEPEVPSRRWWLIGSIAGCLLVVVAILARRYVLTRRRKE